MASMPYSYQGYLQDLSQLEDEGRLLPISNEDTALTNSELPLLSPLCCGTFSSPHVAIPPEIVVVPPSHSKSATDKADNHTTALSPLVTEQEVSHKENNSLILTPTEPSPTDSGPNTNTNTNFNFRLCTARPTIPTGPTRLQALHSRTCTCLTKNQKENIPLNSSPLIQLETTLDLGVPADSKRPGDTVFCPSLNSSLIPFHRSTNPTLVSFRPNEADLFGLELYTESELQTPIMATPAKPVIPSSPPATALATRTTEAVMEDLKPECRNAIHVSKPGPETPNTCEQSGISDLTELALQASTKHDVDVDVDVDVDIDEDADYEESDDEVLPQARPRKITERKRRLNAIADKFIQERNQKMVKEVNKVRPEDELQQSARWLVNQSENREIISTPREYQVELFEKAKEKNLIAVLDTGTGKTLIAVLLLRHVFSQELEDRAMGKPKRVSFFLVDSVQLVFQQHAVLKANLDQPMDMFCGEMGCDMWKKEQWENIFSEKMVIVCTAEVLRQCLHRSFISMDKINLLIFDEAHHAKKDHPYARIIKDFYAQNEDGALLPKIFGMTASPVDANTDVGKAAAELEGILHAQIITTDDPTLMQYRINSKQEQIVKYEILGPKFETPLYKLMHARFKASPILSKPLIFAFEASQQLGAWCADQVWPFCLSETESQKLQAKTERRYHAKKIKEPLELLEKRKEQIVEAKEIIKTHTFQPPDLRTLKSGAPSSNISSKVMQLIWILKERFERPTDDKCIVFVDRRWTARLLASLFSQPNVGTPHLFVGTLVGTRAGEAGDLNASFRDQVVTMMNFRKGNINCIFATSVAEEGLDIPDCNIIIRFDLYTTLIQYIQSRGRARHLNSRYIHMCENDNHEHQQMIRRVRQDENVLKSFCSTLPEDRKLSGNNFNMDYFLSKEKTHRVCKTPKGAKLTYKMSLMVLANFVDSLPHTMEVNLQPEYVMTNQNKLFICEVVLPEESPIRGAIGRPATTKQVAKCSAAFETCINLLKNKYLDDWLCPTFTKQLPAMRNALLAVDSKKREAYDMKTKPNLWSEGGYPDRLFMTVLRLDDPGVLDRPSQPLALLTRSCLPELPSFYLHFGNDRHSLVKSTSLNQPIDVTPEMVGQINTFNICIFVDVFSKLYESDPSKMPYFLVPINQHAQVNTSTDPSKFIDWNILRAVEEYETTWYQTQGWFNNSLWRTGPDEFFMDRYITDPYDGSRKMWTKGVTREYNALSPVPPNSAPRKGTRKNNDNIMEYSCSLWAKARSQKNFDPDQRVFEAELISLRRNLLDETASPEEDSPKKCFIILEPLKVSALPASVVAMAYIFPAIIHRLESYLIALEACELLHLNIRPDLALEAVTKDSDNTDEHDSEQINFQRGMGNNYERLEFLGDCFLKMATSISIFGIHPDNDEYSYHVDRMMLICNKNLKNNAIKLKLYEYIRSQSFNRRAWYPEGLVLKKGKTATAPKSHNLGDKSIADVCEALIGAALLTSHGTKNMDMAVRAVTELVSSENHQVTSFDQYYTLYNKPKYQIAAATEMQRNLALQLEKEHPYQFKYPRLARSAFSHPSYPYSYEHVPSYQRLEFLGDSLLDMACVNFLFHRYENKDPQWLTEHKMAMVSNQFLGALCVSLGFHTHLLIFNTAFQKQITDYVQDITEARNQAEEDAVRAGKTVDQCAHDYWISVRQPPKCLPDIVEAYIGAIFVDSEYNYAEVERFFDSHIRWYFEDMSIYDSYANKHPTTFLTKFLQINMGCAEWTIIPKEIKTIDGSKPRVVAVVIVHGQVVADAEGESSRVAKVAAAKKAVNTLSGLPLAEFRQKFSCDCHADDVGSEEGDLHGTAI